MKLNNIMIDGYDISNGEFLTCDIKLGFKDKNKSFFCSINNLPQEFKNEYESWVNKIEQYVAKNISI